MTDQTLGTVEENNNPALVDTQVVQTEVNSSGQVLVDNDSANPGVNSRNQ